MAKSKMWKISKALNRHLKRMEPRDISKDVQWYADNNVSTCCGAKLIIVPEQVYSNEFICSKCSSITSMISEVCYRNPPSRNII